MLKFIYKTQAEIPAAHAAFYTEKNGEWVLNVDGAVSKADLETFRNQGIEALKAKDADLKKLEWAKDLDSVKVLAAVKATANLSEKDMTKLGELDELVTKRTEKLKAESDQKVAELTGKLTQAEAHLTDVAITGALRAEGLKLGLLPEAEMDFANRGKSVFKLVDGKPVAFNADGTPMYGTDAKPLTVEGWAAEAATKTATFMFKPSAGGGGNGNKGGGGGAGPNPWEKGKENLTQQMTLIRSNRPEALKLAAAAGATLPEGI